MSFIVDKIILRSILASIFPILLYSIGYGIAKLACTPTFAYGDMIPWLCILGISVVYPLNSIGLAMFFEPL